MKNKYLLVAGVAVVGAAQVGACSSKFNTCTDTRTCAANNAGAPDESAGAAGVTEGGAGGIGDAGDGGLGGAPIAPVGGGGDAGSAEAGAGGQTPTPVVACVHDSDCVNPDQADCVVSCGTKDGVPACVVQGVDADQDGFRSASCAAAPGDDCNDGDKAIHPGAVELCDQIDNDCDSKIDLDDGLTLSGTNLRLGGSGNSYPQIAWAADTSVYGVSFLDRTAFETDFTTVDAKGHVQLASKKLIGSPGGNARPVSEIAMTWGKGLFGIVSGFSVPEDATSLTFRTVTSAGDVVDAVGLADVDIPFGVGPVAYQPQVIRDADGTWQVFYQAGYAPSGPLFTEKGFTDPKTVSAGVAGQSVFATPYTNVSAVLVGPNLVLTLDASDHAMGIVPLNGGSQAVNLALSGKHPVIGAATSGAGIAVSGLTATDAPQFFAFQPTGMPVCPAFDLGEPGLVPTSVAASSRGYLVTLRGAGGFVIQEVLSNCTLGRRFTLNPDAATGDVFLASGGGAGNAVTWVASDGVYVRTFGPNFCD